MKKEIAELICSYGDCSIYEKYSGRGMYRDTTVGIQAESVGDLIESIAEALFDMADSEKENYKASDFSFRFDNLGRGIIAY